MRRKKKFVSKYADELMIISSTKVLKIELQNKEYFNAKKVATCIKQYSIVNPKQVNRECAFAGAAQTYAQVTKSSSKEESTVEFFLCRVF